MANTTDQFTERDFTKSLLKSINEYEDTFPTAFMLTNFIREDLSNTKVIDRLDKAVQDGEPIKESDRSFFVP